MWLVFTMADQQQRKPRPDRHWIWHAHASARPNVGSSTVAGSAHSQNCPRKPSQPCRTRQGLLSLSLSHHLSYGDLVLFPSALTCEMDMSLTSPYLTSPARHRRTWTATGNTVPLSRPRQRRDEGAETLHPPRADRPRRPHWSSPMVPMVKLLAGATIREQFRLCPWTAPLWRTASASRKRHWL